MSRPYLTLNEVELTLRRLGFEYRRRETITLHSDPAVHMIERVEYTKKINTYTVLATVKEIDHRVHDITFEIVPITTAVFSIREPTSEKQIIETYTEVVEFIEGLEKKRLALQPIIEKLSSLGFKIIERDSYIEAKYGSDLGNGITIILRYAKTRYQNEGSVSIHASFDDLSKAVEIARKAIEVLEVAQR